MAFPFLRHRALSLASSLLHSTPLQRPKPISSIPSYILSTPTTAPTIPTPSFSHSTRLFTSTSILFRKTFDPDTDEIGPDTILFEGCDYNHWLITVDFPKDGSLTREQMIDTYINIASQVFGRPVALIYARTNEMLGRKNIINYSVDEAKKKIYALSTTTYQGFQVECSEETSEKFKSIPGVVFVLPDSYIDPVNKEYGGDKYVNGTIFPRPPPVHYGRRSNRDRNPREQMGYQQRNAPYTNQGPPHSEVRNYGPPSQQSYWPPPPQQNYGSPPPRHNYGPPPQQAYGPPRQQNNGQSPQQNYGSPSQQTYGSPSQQTYRPPHQQNYGQSPQWQGYGSPQQSYGQQPQQSCGTPSQQNYVPPPQQSHDNLSKFSDPQNYTTRPSHSASGHGEINPVPSHQEGFNQAGRANNYTQGQKNFQQGTGQSDASLDQRGFLQDANHGSTQDGGVELVPSGQRKFRSMQNN